MRDAREKKTRKREREEKTAVDFSVESKEEKIRDPREKRMITSERRRRERKNGGAGSSSVERREISERWIKSAKRDETGKGERVACQEMRRIRRSAITCGGYASRRNEEWRKTEGKRE